MEEKTIVEREREIEETILKVEDLGMTVIYKGVKMEAHKAFVRKVHSLAQRAGIDNMGGGIWRVRDKLPRVIKNKVKESYGTWCEFCKAIESIESSYIRDKLQEDKEEKEEELL